VENQVGRSILLS